MKKATVTATPAKVLPFVPKPAAETLQMVEVDSRLVEAVNHFYRRFGKMLVELNECRSIGGAA